MSKSKKTLLVALSVVLIAGIASYFVNPDLFQGLIFRRTTRVTVEDETVTKKIVDRFPEELAPFTIDSKTIKRDIDRQFEEMKRNLPEQALISYGPMVDLSIKIKKNQENYQPEFVKEYLKDIKLVTTPDNISTPRLDTIEEIFNPTPVEPLPEEPYGLENVPDDFLWVSTMTGTDDQKYFLIDPATVTEDAPKLATATEVCNYGTQDAEISSIALDLKGGYNWGSVTFNIFHEDEALWDNAIEASVGDWPGDMSFTPFSLQPDECTYFHVEYYDIGDGEDQPDWAKFDLRGLGTNLPTYYLMEDYLVLLEEGNNPMPGILNVFNPIEEILVYYLSADYEIPKDKFYPYTQQSVYLGNFDLRTLANSTAQIESLTINVDTTYEEPLEATFNMNKYDTPWNFIYNYFDSSSELEVTLQSGINIIPFNEFFDYAEKVYIQIHVPDLPGEPDPDAIHTIKLTLEDIGTEAIKSEGNPDYNNKKEFDGKEARLVTIGGVPSEKPNLIIYYSPTWWKEKFYSEQQIASLVADDNPPQIFSIDFNTTVTSPVPILVDPFEIKVKGNFTQPLDVKIYKGGFGFYDPEEFISVLPGDVINMDAFDLTNGQNFYCSIYAMNAPADAGDITKYVGFEVPGIGATYGEYEGIDYVGEDVPLSIYDMEYNDLNPDFIFPIKPKKTLFGEILLHAKEGYSEYAPIEYIYLDEVTSEDVYMLNSVELLAQGDTKLYKFIYQHTANDKSPFGDEDLILETNNNIMYVKDAVWTTNDLTFTLTNPEELNHDEKNYLKLNMKVPENILGGAVSFTAPMWFGLSSVEATDQSSSNNEINVYTESYPIKKELSENDSIMGTVFIFSPLSP